MNYEKFNAEIPLETRKLIEKAMEIYSIMEKTNLLCNVYSAFDEVTQKLLSKIDKKCGALFLAGLLVDGAVKEVLNDCDITADKVLKYLGIELKDIKKLTSEQYKNHFEKDFKTLCITFLNKNESGYRTLPTENFFTEIIISNLAFQYVCNSDIVAWFYKDARWQTYGLVFQHSSFAIIREIAKHKLESVKQIKKPFMNISDIKEDEDINLGCISTFPSNKDNKFANNNLERYGAFLSDKEYQTNPAIGRDKEIKNLMLSLLIPEKSAILVGEAGVGKTTIVEGLAYLIKNKQVPKSLENKRIIKMNTSAILQGCMYVGMFEQRVEAVIQELIKQPNVILFIDEIHNVIGAGSSSNKDMDLANILKPYLDRGQIKMIGATTTEEYEEYIMSDSAFKRRFERVNILEPEELIVGEILNGSIPKIEQATNVEFDFVPEDRSLIIEHIVNTTHQKNRLYNDKVNNPDLSLTILKKAFAYAALYDCKNVQVEHIAESIRTCERITESVRNRQASTLLAIFEKARPVSLKPVCKIIEFPKTRLIEQNKKR